MLSLFRKTAIALIVGCLTAVSSYAAETILPPAEGKHSVPFVLPKTNAPLPVGARVEFIATNGSEVPRRLKIFGFVLGTKQNVSFLELSERDAIRLAFARSSQSVRVAKVADPDPEVLAQRRQLHAERTPVQVAPSMRMFTVRVSSSTEAISDWNRGDTLVFRDAKREKHPRVVEGLYFKVGDAQATLLSISPTEDGYDLSLLSDPRDAPEILLAEAEGRLKLERKRAIAAAKAAEPLRCYIRHRRGEEITSIEIPCKD